MPSPWSSTQVSRNLTRTWVHLGACTSNVGAETCDAERIRSAAKALRNQGPTVPLASCADATIARRLEDFLKQPGKSRDELRGSGEHQEVQYHTAMREDLIMAGRVGIVKQVDTRCRIYSYGIYQLVAEIRFNVDCCQMLSFSAAVAAHDGQFSPQPLTVEQVRDLRHTGSSEDVRFVGGELLGYLALFLQTMREVMATQVAAWSPWERPPAVAGSAPLYSTSPYYVFVVGPVHPRWRGRLRFTAPVLTTYS